MRACHLSPHVPRYNNPAASRLGTIERFDWFSSRPRYPRDFPSAPVPSPPVGISRVLGSFPLPNNTDYETASSSSSSYSSPSRLVFSIRGRKAKTTTTTKRIRFIGSFSKGIIGIATILYRYRNEAIYKSLDRVIFNLFDLFIFFFPSPLFRFLFLEIMHGSPAFSRNERHSFIVSFREFQVEPDGIRIMENR